MAENSKIEWCTHTFNIAWGCSKVSPGCANCYADTLSHRYGFDVWGPGKDRRTFGEKHWREPLAWDRKAKEAGERHRVFCSSMCDVFEDHPTIDAEREKLWPLIRQTPNLDWLILSKRADRMAEYVRRATDSLGGIIAGGHWPTEFPNVCLGVSVEDQQRADERIPRLLQTPAAVRFLSCEPLIGPVTFKHVNVRNGPDGFDALNPLTGGMRGPRAVCGSSDRRIHWVIVGGESGPGARPMDVAWARSIVKQCKAANVACFVKQFGSNAVQTLGGQHTETGTRQLPFKLRDRKGGDINEFPDDLRVREFPSRGNHPFGVERAVRRPR